MRTCGNCRWLNPPESRKDECYPVCFATPTSSFKTREIGCCACTLWKPKQDWREETCGTCEFQGKPYPDCRERCLRHPSVVIAEDDHYACAEWMPREE